MENKSMTALETELHLPVYERHFGRMDIMTLPVGSLICLSQIRDKANPVYDQLKESIDQEDLDNPPNVARLSDTEMAAYIDFTNQTWGESAELKDLEPFRHTDGLFNLVVAGHNRASALKDLAAQHERETGQPTAFTVDCKIMKDTSIEAIVSKQASENLHASVSQERTAMVLVELYTYGLRTGKWASPEEFSTSQGKRVNRRMVADALTFAALPQGVRSIVLGGKISYKAGVELGKAAPTIRAYFAQEAGLAADTDNADISTSVSTRLNMEVAHIRTSKLNSTAATRYIQSVVDAMQQKLALLDSKGDAVMMSDVQQPLFSTLKSSATIAYEIRRREESRHARALRELSAGPAKLAAEVMFHLTSPDSPMIVEAVLNDTVAAQQRLVERIGSASLNQEARVLHLVKPDFANEPISVIA